MADLYKISEELVKKIRFNKRKYPTYVVGSIRRKVDKPNDIDILVIIPKDQLIGTLPKVHLIKQTKLKLTPISAGNRRWTGYVNTIRLDIFAATEEERAYALYHHTGSKLYNIQMRAHAKYYGMKLNQYGLFRMKAIHGAFHKVRGSTAVKTERQLASFLGITYDDPVNRV